MPNWCRNRLSVCGPPDDVARFVKAARGRSPLYDESRLPPSWREKHEPPEEALCFHALVPVPAAIVAGPYTVNGFRGGGYEWENAHWGCKWGSSESKLVGHTPGRATFTFRTPWGPGLAFHDTVAKEWPTLHFYLSYGEEYPSRGRIVWRRKKRLKEATGRKVREELPKALYVGKGEEDDEAAWKRQNVWEEEYLLSHERWVDEQEPARVRAS